MLFIFFIGLIMMIIGFSTLFLYITLFGFGYTFKEYMMYILSIKEFYLLILGFIFVSIYIFKKGRKKC